LSYFTKKDIEFTFIQNPVNIQDGTTTKFIEIDSTSSIDTKITINVLFRKISYDIYSTSEVHIVSSSIGTKIVEVFFQKDTENLLWQKLAYSFVHKLEKGETIEVKFKNETMTTVEISDGGTSVTLEELF